MSAVSVHAYSPPLTVMSYYEVDAAVPALRRVRTASGAGRDDRGVVVGTRRLYDGVGQRVVRAIRLRTMFSTRMGTEVWIGASSNWVAVSRTQLATADACCAVRDPVWRISRFVTSSRARRVDAAAAPLRWAARSCQRASCARASAVSGATRTRVTHCPSAATTATACGPCGVAPTLSVRIV